MSDEIRIDPEKIDVIIRQLEELYHKHNGLYCQIVAQCQQLENGAWIGKAARLFYVEMNELVAPSLIRTHEAFEHLANALDVIKACFADAEEEGKNLVENGLNGNSGAGGGAGAGAVVGGGVGAGAGEVGGGNQAPTRGNQGHYTVQAGDNLWNIAQRYGVTVDELVVANNIPNRDLIYPGQVLIIPGQGAGYTPPIIPPSGVNTAPHSQNPFGFAPEGIIGADGKKRWGSQHDLDINDKDIPWNTADNRSQSNYMRALHYLNVDDQGNARYAPNKYGTHCDTFVVDATRILNRPIPNVINLDNGSVKYLGVRDMNLWLDGRMPGVGADRQGVAIGWRVADSQTALQYAQNGSPAIAISSGHIAMINPSGGRHVDGIFYPNVAQAGATNTYNGNVYDQFRSELSSVRYFVAK